MDTLNLKILVGVKDMTVLSNSHFTITIQGLNIHYEMYHDDASKHKPTIVLIHGYLSSTFSFRRLIPLLAKEYRVIALDLPPFGKSEKSKRFFYTYGNLANIVIELLEILSIKDIVLIGHSMGGQISLHVIKQRPELVRKVVLLCSSSYLDRTRQSLLLSTYIPFFSLFLKDRMTKQGVRRNLVNVVYDQTMIDEEMMQGYEQPFNDNQIFNALTRLIRHREADLSSKDLQAFDTKSLLIWGREDKIVPLQVGKRLHEDLKHSQLITLDKTGHLLPEEKPHQIYEHIMEFL
jgi:pimeloyl-ACP methyl ester carboxylesterase